MRKAVTTVTLFASMLLLSGCASHHGGQQTKPTPASSASSQATSTQGAFTIDHITSCDDIEGTVAPYIAGLVPREDNVVDKWAVSCSWEAAEDNIDPANIRIVSVHLSPIEDGAEAPDSGLIEQMEGGSVIQDSWVNSNGGIAYSWTTGTAVAGTTTTTIWLPGFEASFTGAQWGDFPVLDSAAAVKAVKRLVR